MEEKEVQKLQSVCLEVVFDPLILSTLFMCFLDKSWLRVRWSVESSLVLSSGETRGVVSIGFVEALVFVIGGNGPFFSMGVASSAATCTTNGEFGIGWMAIESAFSLLPAARLAYRILPTSILQEFQRQ